jgi:hypothetical protein
VLSHCHRDGHRRTVGIFHGTVTVRDGDSVTDSDGAITGMIIMIMIARQLEVTVVGLSATGSHGGPGLSPSLPYAGAGPGPLQRHH